MDDSDPTTIRAQTCSNESGLEPRLIDVRRTPGTETIATPPWLTDIVEQSDGGRGRGRSTLWYPSERRRRKQMESTSCHVSTRHRTSTLWSRRTSSKSSTLLFKEQMLMHPNVRRPAGDRWRTSTSTRGREQLIGRRWIRGTLVTMNAPFSTGLSLGTARRRPARQPRYRRKQTAAWRRESDKWQTVQSPSSRSRCSTVSVGGMGVCNESKQTRLYLTHLGPSTVMAARPHHTATAAVDLYQEFNDQKLDEDTENTDGNGTERNSNSRRTRSYTGLDAKQRRNSRKTRKIAEREKHDWQPQRRPTTVIV